MEKSDQAQTFNNLVKAIGTRICEDYQRQNLYSILLIRTARIRVENDELKAKKKILTLENVRLTVYEYESQ